MSETPRSAAEFPAGYLITNVEGLDVAERRRLDELLADVASLGRLSIQPIGQPEITTLQESEPEPHYITFEQFLSADSASSLLAKGRTRTWTSLHQAYNYGTNLLLWSPEMPRVQQLFRGGGRDVRAASLNVASLCDRMRTAFKAHNREDTYGLAKLFPDYVGVPGIEFLADLVNNLLEPAVPLRVPGWPMPSETQGEITLSALPGTLNRDTTPKTPEQKLFFETITIEDRPLHLVTAESLRQFAIPLLGVRRTRQIDFVEFVALLDRQLARQEGRSPTQKPETVALSPAIFLRAVRDLPEYPLGKYSAYAMNCVQRYADMVEVYLATKADAAQQEQDTA